MKGIIPIFFILALTSCSFAGDIYFSEVYKDTPLYYGDFNEVKTRDDICRFIHERVEYRSDFIDSKSSPRETLKNGYGDCEDFSILYLNILYVVFREKGELVLVDSADERTIEKGGIITHAIVRLPSGKLLEPQTGKIVDYPIGYSYVFDDIF